MPPARFRVDGLVEERLGRSALDEARLSEDLFWPNYSWVAMLDPNELSRGTVLTDLRADVVAGRPAGGRGSGSRTTL